MYKLLSAEFIRLRKSFVFRLGLCFSAGLGSFIVLMRWMDVKQNAKIYAELGTEYKNADGLIFVSLQLLYLSEYLWGRNMETEPFEINWQWAIREEAFICQSWQSAEPLA